MFIAAEILTTTMFLDNEVVMRYIEKGLDGVIPDSYREAAAGRIRY